jgi:hypothetical protein
VGNVNAVSASEKVDRVIKVAGAGFKKIQLKSPASGAQSTDKLNAKKVAGLTKLTQAPVDSGFTKMTRNRSTLVKRANVFNPSGVKNMIYANLESNISITASKPVEAALNARTLSASDTAYTTAASNYTQYLMVMNFPSSSWQYIYHHQEYEFYRTQWFYDQVEAQYIKQPLDVHMMAFVKPGTATSLGFADYVLETLDPAEAITSRVTKLIQLQEKGNVSYISALKPIMAYPVIDKPMYEELIKLSTEYLLPNASQYPNNSITLLQTNTRFIESYFAGLNHEFSRELLWREYPTDQRGSYFRKFWNTDDTIDKTDNNPLSLKYNPDYLFDIKALHQWGNSHLGENHMTARHGSDEKIVLLIRGDFLKKFPNALIYIQKAHKPAAQRTLMPLVWDQLDNDNTPDPTVVKFPMFKASVQPDISLLGFDISKDDIVGGTTESPHGWFVVFRERPGQIKFGLDEPPQPTPFSTWNDANWAHLGSSPKYVDLSLPFPTPITPQGISWASDSASMASILYQKPVIIAVHADDMIP